MTVETDIEVALLKRAEVARAATGLQAAWPNKAFTPTGAAYLAVQHLPNDPQRQTLDGTETHYRQGFLQITVKVPLGGGPSAATAYAGQIAAQFPADLPLFEGGVKLKVQKAPRVVPAIKSDTTWDVPVSIPYETFA